MVEYSRWGRRARIAALAGPAAALVLLVGAPAAAAANTLYVNAATGVDSPSCGASSSPCQTIQQAVDNASSGDTIQVAAGTYDESVAMYTSGLTLEGAQAGNPGSAARASEDPATESVVTGTLNIYADNVTVDGFSFSSPYTQVYDLFASNATVENSEFTGYNRAILVTAAPATKIIGNYFTTNPAFEATGVIFNDGGCDNTVVSDNTFYGAANDGLGTIFFYCNDLPSAGITVSGNTDVDVVGDTNGESFLVAEWVHGDIHATDNHVSAASTSGSVFWFTLSPHLGAVDVSGNSVVGSVSAGVVIRPSGGGAGTTYTITGNRLSAGKYGVYISSGPLAAGATVAIHGNDLAGNSGDGVLAGGSVDAIDNWWGCNAGPGHPGCSAVSGAVTFDPWLVLGVSASPTLVAAGSSSTVTADVTHDSAGVDVSALGTIPDGTSIGFSTDLGSLSASSAGTSGGKASVTLTSSSGGTADASATLDGQTVSTPVAVVSAALCKKGGWQSYGVFKNQGDCVSFAATGGRNRPG